MDIKDVLFLIMGVPSTVYAIIKIWRVIFPPPPPSPPPPLPTPPPPNFFIGREKELKNIKSFLDNHVPVLIWGLGGVGKSALADRVGQDFLKNKIEVSEKSAYTIIKELAEIQKIKSDGLSEDVLINRLKDTLRKANGNELFILDDFISKNITDDEKRLNKISEALEPAKIIITSRTNLVYNNMKKVELKNFSRKDSEKLVERVLEESNKKHIWDEIQNNPSELKALNGLFDVFDGLVLDVKLLGEYLSLFNFSEKPTLIPLYDKLCNFGEGFNEDDRLWERDKIYFQDFFQRLGRNEQDIFRIAGLFSSEPFTSDFVKFLAEHLLELDKNYHKSFENLNWNSIFTPYKYVENRQYYTVHSRLKLFIDHNLREYVKELDSPEQWLQKIKTHYINLMAGFNITEQILENLKSSGFPVDLLKKLEDIKHQQILNRDKFLEIFKTTLTIEEIERYKIQILNDIEYIVEKNAELAVANASHVAHFSSILFEFRLYDEVIDYAEKVGWFLNSHIQWDEFRQTLETGIDAAEKLINNSNDNIEANEIKAKFSIDIGRTYRYQNLYDLAIDKFNSATILPVNARLVAEAYKEIIFTKQRASNIDEIPNLLEKEIPDILERIEKFDLIDIDKSLVLADCYTFVGRMYFDTDNKQKAIDSLTTSKSLVDKLKNNELNDEQLTIKTDIILNIGNSYFHNGLEFKGFLSNKDKDSFINDSKNCYMESLDLCRSLKEHKERMFAFTYDQLGQWELKANNLDEAEAYNKKAHECYQGKGQVDGCAYAYDHLGEVYMSRAYQHIKGDIVNHNLVKEYLKEAENYFHRSLMIFEEKKKLDGIAYLLHHKGEAVEYLYFLANKDKKYNPLEMYERSKSLFEGLNLMAWVEHLRWHILNFKIANINKNKIRKWFKIIDPEYRGLIKEMNKIDKKTENIDNYKSNR